MKKTNFTKALYTGLFTSILVSTTTLAAIPTMQLLKAEPISHSNLKSHAEDNLMQSFSAIELDASYIKINTKHKLIANKVKKSESSPVRLAKTSLTAD